MKNCKIFSFLLLGIVSLVLVCCSKKTEPQIQLPNWFETPSGKIIFISMYLTEEGTLIDPSDTDSMRGGMQKLQRNATNTPIMVTTFSYSFYSQGTISASKVSKELSVQISRYPMCNQGYEVTNIYQGKVGSKSAHKIANVYSGFCRY